MEKNVQTLLETEQQVNRMVQEALKQKRETLGKIQAEAEIDVAQYKKELEQEKKLKIE